MEAVNGAYLLHILQLALQGSVVWSFPSVETLKTNAVSVISAEEECESRTHFQPKHLKLSNNALTADPRLY